MRAAGAGRVAAAGLTCAASLPPATLERVAWGLGLHRWTSREELEALVGAWPGAPPPASRFAPMSRKMVEREIDGVKYRVLQMGMETADEFIFRVGRVGAALLDADKSLYSFFTLLHALPPSEFRYVVNALRDTTEVCIVDHAGEANKAGEKRATWVKLSEVYNNHFAGDGMGAWSKWIGFAMEASFGRFFGDLLDAIRRRTAAFSSLFPKASAGSSGGSSPTSE